MAFLTFLVGIGGPSLWIDEGHTWRYANESLGSMLSTTVGSTNAVEAYDDVLTLDGVMLWDLLQVGSDGSCGYHNIYVGSATPPFRYCLIHEARILFRAPSFLDGMLLAIHQTAGTWAPTE